MPPSVKGYYRKPPVEQAEWETPDWLFNALDEEFQFELDVCATDDNAKCAEYFTEKDDCLVQDWQGKRCFMNPPYGSLIGQFMHKAYDEANRGATVVCLVFAKTETKWWWETARFGEVRFINGRIKFGGAKHNAPFPSAVVIFGPSILPKMWHWDVSMYRENG